MMDSTNVVQSDRFNSFLAVKVRMQWEYMHIMYFRLRSTSILHAQNNNNNNCMYVRLHRYIPTATIMYFLYAVQSLSMHRHEDTIPHIVGIIIQPSNYVLKQMPCSAWHVTYIVIIQL